MPLDIRAARDTDLVALVDELGQRSYFMDRLKRQADDRGLLLIAWLEDRPIGDVYLWLEPAEEPELREHLPGTPLLTHIEIHPEHRKRGHGVSLMRAAEQELVSQGHRLVALAVELGNHDVMPFYRRLSYREWPYPPVPCLALADGIRPRRVEICRILVKGLS